MGIFSGLKILLVVGLLASAGGGFMYIKNLKANLEIAKANVAKLEVAVETSEQSLALLKKDNERKRPYVWHFGCRLALYK